MSEPASSQATPLAIVEAVSEPSGPELNGKMESLSVDQLNNGLHGESEGDGDEDEEGAGDVITKTKKKSKKSKKKKKSGAGVQQSDPPRVGISKFFPSGQYPVGEIKEYLERYINSSNS